MRLKVRCRAVNKLLMLPVIKKQLPPRLQTRETVEQLTVQTRSNRCQGRLLQQMMEVTRRLQVTWQEMLVRLLQWRRVKTTSASPPPPPPRHHPTSHQSPATSPPPPPPRHHPTSHQ